MRRRYLKKLVLNLKALHTINLPEYKGSTFRGGFGHAFKRVVCTVRDTDCEECLLKSKCIYSYVFETPPPENTEILRKYRKAPHPFIIEPPDEKKRTYKPGDDIVFNLVLIGRAEEYLPYFIYTFEELGRTGIGKGRGRYELAEVSHNGTIIYSSTNRQLKSLPSKSDSISSLLNALTQSAKLITLSFTTPTRMIFKEDLVVDLEFHHLVRTLLRRFSSLSYFHFGERLDLDFKKLIEKAKKVKVASRELHWHDWERYSARQDTRMKMGGFTGKVTFEGDLAEFLPIIKAGEIVHVGKATSFGLGKYEIIEML